MVTTGICILLCAIALVVGANVGLLVVSLLAIGKEKNEVVKVDGEKSLVDSLRQIGKYTDLVPNYFLIAADRIEELEKPIIKTNLDRVRHLSEEEIIDHIYKYDKLLDKICFSKNVCPYGDKVQPENCKECIKKWLEAEVNQQ